MTCIIHNTVLSPYIETVKFRGVWVQWILWVQFSMTNIPTMQNCPNIITLSFQEHYLNLMQNKLLVLDMFVCFFCQVIMLRNLGNNSPHFCWDNELYEGNDNPKEIMEWNAHATFPYSTIMYSKSLHNWSLGNTHSLTGDTLCGKEFKSYLHDGVCMSYPLC